MKANQKIRSLFTLTLSVIILGLNAGCTYGFTGIEGDGKVVKEERKISSFDGLDIGGAFHVYLTQGSQEALTIEADENLLEVIETKVTGGTLEISTTKSIKDYEELNVYITFKELRDMEISGACHLTGENKFSLSDMDMDFSGACNITLELEANELDCDFSGASQVDLSGRCDRMKLDVSGASDYDAYELEVGTLDADISGAAHARVNVADELTADVSGASSLKYKGDPKVTHRDVSGAASMKKY